MQKDVIPFEISSKYKFLNQIGQIAYDENKCSIELPKLYDRNTITHLINNHFGDGNDDSYDDNNNRFWEITCSKLKKYALNPCVVINQKMTRLENSIFYPNFFRFHYFENTSRNNKQRSITPLSIPYSPQSPLSPNATKVYKFQKKIRNLIKNEIMSENNHDQNNDNDDFYDNYNHYQYYNDGWLQALQNHDSEQIWINNIYSQLNKLAQCRTGHCILTLIGTFWKPGEILFTNKNSTRLSANVMFNLINIPSLPRFICYFGENESLVHSELWMVLGHELLHLIHKRFGIHTLNNPKEEENTVQGDYDPEAQIDFGVFRINGENYILTENQFRLENEIGPRNGYGSVAVCSIFDKSGCKLYNKYGNGTCQIIQNFQH
jgi:hypothetical protein